MKHEPWQLIRVVKPFKTEAADYPLGEVFNVRASLAKKFQAEGLVEFVSIDDLEDEDSGDDEPGTNGPEWKEPDLGSFHFDDFGWVAPVTAPALKKFKFGKKRGKSAETCVLRFVGDTADDQPAPAAVALAKRVVGDLATLLPMALEALWADFTGTGPDSGMYWHGDLNEVAAGLETGQPPRSANDLFELMRPDEIRVCAPGGAGFDEIRVELNFRAAFEDEHGVGVLTDGVKVTGIGYSGEASLFKPVR